MYRPAQMVHPAKHVHRRCELSLLVERFPHVLLPRPCREELLPLRLVLDLWNMEVYV
jgi:hypothetical protein